MILRNSPALIALFFALFPSHDLRRKPLGATFGVAVRRYSWNVRLLRTFLKYLMAICSAGALSPNAFGQDHGAIDSLHALLKSQSGAERFPTLYELTFQYNEYDEREALKYIEEAYKAAVLARDSLRIVKSMRVKGQILSSLGRILEGSRILEEALPPATRLSFNSERLDRNVKALVRDGIVFV